MRSGRRRNLVSGSTRKTVILLPNSRSHPGEESCDSSFSQLLSDIAPVYINEAFSASHRNHASITGVAKLLPHYAGKRMLSEIEHLTYARNNAQNGLIIIGGAKFDTKIQLIQYYLNSGSRVCVVGALAHAVYVARGHTIGTSFVDSSIDASSWCNHSQLWVPTFVVVRSLTGLRTCNVSDVATDEQIVDAGIASVAELGAMIVSAHTVVWNGPLGLYEDGFLAATNEIKKYMCQTNAFRVVGGGDTLACIDESERSLVANFCSTGGGAMLEFLSTGTLVGIDALN